MISPGPITARGSGFSGGVGGGGGVLGFAIKTLLLLS
jgi:hypothetical protein